MRGILAHRVLFRPGPASLVVPAASPINDVATAYAVMALAGTR
ncbi:MAG TPA: hypothetical protein VNH18_33155 [Bryobacteraceae bacterium]|nr:hypothetical protein [Bryobacteraceae bacterium]